MDENSEVSQAFRHSGRNVCPKVILEGTRLTKKTELAFALNEHPNFVGPRKYRYHSPIISGEWGGFTNAPWGEGLLNFSKEREAWALRTYELWIQLLEHLPYCSWIVDRFYMSTQAHQWIHNHQKYDFQWLEDRLKALGFRLVLCYRRQESFLDARKERLKISGNPSQYDNLARIIREQELLFDAFRHSKLEKLMIDITDRTVASLAEEITAWLERSGALYGDDRATKPESVPSSRRVSEQCAATVAP
jgi:hypothetical protein